MKRSTGFTLIELMIVVAIIALLSSLAIPAYFKYLSKAKQAEVAINLASIHTAQQMYFAEHGEYSSDLTKIGWKPSKNTYYTYGFSIPGSREGTNFFTGKLGTPVQSLKKTSAKKDSFTAAAAGNVVGGKVDIWTIDENRNLTNLQNGID